MPTNKKVSKKVRLIKKNYCYTPCNLLICYKKSSNHSFIHSFSGSAAYAITLGLCHSSYKQFSFYPLICFSFIFIAGHYCSKKSFCNLLCQMTKCKYAFHSSIISFFSVAHFYFMIYRNIRKHSISLI